MKGKLIKTEFKVSDYMDEEFERGKMEISISPQLNEYCVLNIHQEAPNRYSYIGLKFRDQIDAILFFKTIADDLEKQLINNTNSF